MQDLTSAGMNNVVIVIVRVGSFFGVGIFSWFLLRGLERRNTCISSISFQRFAGLETMGGPLEPLSP